MKNITIYNDDICEYIDKYSDDIKNALHDDDMQINDENIQYYASFYIADDLIQLKELLKAYDEQNNNSKYIVVGSLGLWYGRRKIKATFTSLHNAIFKCFEDVNKVYFYNNAATIQIDANHHDGCNNFKIYKLVNGKRRAIKYLDMYNNF